MITCLIAQHLHSLTHIPSSSGRLSAWTLILDVNYTTQSATASHQHSWDNWLHVCIANKCPKYRVVSKEDGAEPTLAANMVCLLQLPGNTEKLLWFEVFDFLTAVLIVTCSSYHRAGILLCFHFLKFVLYGYSHTFMLIA